MKPTIGNWYRIQGSDSFEVVAYDEDDGTIELQYFDGTVEEMDIQDWQAAGATHFSLNTMGSGFDTPEKHLAALRRFAEVFLNE